MAYVFGTGERISIDMAALAGDTSRPYNVHLGQDKLAEIALSHLRRHSHATVEFGATVTGLTQDDTGVNVHAIANNEARTYRAAWVIGADGARSNVRQALGLSFDGITWPERFVATNVRVDFARLGFADATMLIDPKYGCIVARLDNEGLWRCTYCEDASLPEESVLERMPAHFAGILPPADKDYELVQYSPYRMHQRAAERFRVGRVLLAGDAAHVTNPTGGLGLTSGLFDAYVLHEALAAVIKGEIDDSVLDRYSDERKEAFWKFASPPATDAKRLVFHSSDPGVLAEQASFLRQCASDRALARENFLMSKRVETPSLLREAVSG